MTAKDEYIIRKMEAKIVKSSKAKLLWILFDVILESMIIHFSLIVVDLWRYFVPKTYKLLVWQTFSMLIVSRFQGINLNKDGGIVKGIFDLKNEVKIITSPDETFKLWKEFLEKHSIGGLINPDIMARFN
jgi:hypothetical protein